MRGCSCGESVVFYTCTPLPILYMLHSIAYTVKGIAKEEKNVKIVLNEISSLDRPIGDDLFKFIKEKKVSFWSLREIISFSNFRDKTKASN